MFLSFLNPPGGVGPKLWGVHHPEPSRKRLWRQTETAGQPKAVI